jgi:hypothetical protein
MCHIHLYRRFLITLITPLLFVLIAGAVWPASAYAQGPLNPEPWLSLDSLPTTSVAWGDVDGDGDLDLAVGNAGLVLDFGGVENQVFENVAGRLNDAPLWISDDAAETLSVA